MNPISLIVGIIGHATLLIKCERDIESIINNIFKTHKENFPSLEEFKTLAQDALEVLKTGLVPIPSELSAQLSQIFEGVVNVVVAEQKQIDPDSVA